MNLGIFLGIGESLKQMEKSGQKDRFINLYLKRYAKDFSKVYLFSYENESCTLPENVIIVPKKLSVHRYLYSLLIPIVNHKQVNDCDIIRGFGLTSTIPAFFTHKPFVFNLPYNYSDFLKIEKKFMFIPIFKLLESLAPLRANKVFIATKEKLSTLKGSKFVYLPNGVDLALFKTERHSSSGIVFAGRFEKQKNLFFLIDAISKLTQKNKEITFIGSGSQEKSLKKYAVYKNVKLIILHPVKNSELPKALSKFSIFTLTSVAEGSPKALLEAMAIGLVPVITDFPTAKEFVENNKNGFRLPFDEALFSKQLGMILKSKPILNRFSTEARLSVEKKYDIGKIIGKEINFLKSVNLND